MKSLTREENEWRNQLKTQQSHKSRKLEVHEPSVKGDDFEDCVICDKPTLRWLYPENAPLCGDACLNIYLKDPTVYDPRGLYGEPSMKPTRHQGVDMAQRRCDVRIGARWETVPFSSLKKDDVFRLFEPNGDLVIEKKEGKEISAWVCLENAAPTHGVWGVNVDPVELDETGTVL